MKIVEGTDVVGYVGYLELHVLGVICWHIEVEILDVDGNETCTFGGDDTDKEDFGGKHVSCGWLQSSWKTILLPPTIWRMQYGSSFSGQKFAQVLLYVASFLQSGII